MPSVGRLLKAHNQKVLKLHQGDSTDQDSATCNCRNKTNCPLSGKCQIKSIVYQANVLSEDGASYSYIGLSKSVGQIIVKALRMRPTKLQQSNQNSYGDSRELIEIHYQLANTNKMPSIQARCENVKLVPDRKALNHQKSDLHQQQDRACLKMQAIKETLDNTLLLSLFHLLYTLLLDLKQSTVVPVTENTIKYKYICIY